MEDNIPKLFKHRWLDITLRFIKNDDQTVLEYPEMPVAHVDYLHCIWQRQNIEPGFEALYKSLKEAMSISCVKYKFEVMKTLLGDVGQLKIRKIPRTYPQPQTSNASGIVTQIKTKPKQPSKTQKYVAATKKIIESVSPSFIRSNFQKILDFIKDKASGSLTFTNLAPIEASLLHQFLGIYNRKEAFSEYFSPACNDILEKMSVAFKEFDKNAKLEICVVKTDMSTRKRELTYLKVPRYTNNTTSKAKLRQNGTEKKETESEDRSNQELKNKDKTNLDKTDNIRNKEVTIKKNKPINNNNLNKTTTDKENVEKNKLLTAIDTETKVSKNTDNATINFNTNGKVTKDKKTISNNNRAVLDNNRNDNTAIDNKVDVKVYKPIPAIDKETIESIVNSKSNSSSSVSQNIKNTTIDNKGNIQITLSIDTKSINDSKANKDNDVTKDITKVNSETVDIITEHTSKSKKKREKRKKLDKNDFIKDINEINEIRKKLPKQTILFKKANEGLTSEEVAEKYKFHRSTQKNQLLEAMSTPMNSVKGLRIMQLMGWDGGALGIRGEGIVEPLIPELSHMSGAGLGHAAERHTRKQEKHVIRMEFLENILNLVEKNLSVSIISYKEELSKKDRRFCNEMIQMFNKKNNSLGKQQSEIGDKIVSKIADGEILLDMTISKCKKLITLRNLKLTTNTSEQTQTKNENVSLKKKKDNVDKKEKDNVDKKEKDSVNKKKKDNADKKEKDNVDKKEKDNVDKKEKDSVDKKKKDNADKKEKDNVDKKEKDSVDKKKDNADKKEKDNVDKKEKDSVDKKEKDNVDKKKKDNADKKEKDSVDKKKKDNADKKEKDKAKVTIATNKAQFKELVLSKVLELLKSDNNYLMLDFDEGLTRKHCQFVGKVCDRINKRRRLPVIIGSYIYEMYEKEIVYHTGDSYLALEFGEDLQSLTIHKLKENPNIRSTDNILKTKDNNNNTKDTQVNVAKKVIEPFIILIKPTNDKQFAKTITNLITDKIEMEDDFLPCLKSHGIQNGFLVYSCANKISCLWLKDVLNDYNVIDYRGIDNKYVVQIKLKEHMDVDKVLLLLDKYNNGLDVSKWRMLEEFLFKVDVESFEYICNNNFRLNAGVDEVEFNIHYANT